MNIGASMSGGNPAEGRVDNDFYPTEAAATHALIRFLKKQWQQDILVWECACGKGDMSDVMMEYSFIKGVISTDLIDRGYGTGGVDFLQVKELPKTDRGLYDTIITNQPFDLTYDFINHANEIGARRLVLLMKAQFWNSNWLRPPYKTKSIWNSWRPSWWLPNCWRLQFREGSESSSTMDTAWCVWDRDAKHEGCLMVPLEKPIGM